MGFEQLRPLVTLLGNRIALFRASVQESAAGDAIDALSVAGVAVHARCGAVVLLRSLSASS